MTSSNNVHRRYGYVILAGIVCILAIFSILYIAQQVAHNNVKICLVITSVTDVPVDKPLNPLLDSTEEREYLLYLKFVHLGEALGCKKGPA